MGTRVKELQPLPADPSVSVITPARNASATLAAAVRSALEQPVDEVIVAVAPSEDDTAQVAADLARLDSRVRVVDNPPGTTPSGLQRALERASGDVIVRVDAHSELPPGYVAQAIRTLRATGAANVGGKQVPAAEPGFGEAVAAAMRSPAGSGGATYRSGETPGPADTVYLGVYHREALEQVGGFNEAMIRNQDYELNERLRRAGYVVYFDPELEVRYRPRGTVAGLARQYVAYGRWRRVTLRLHPGSLRLRQLAAPALVVGLLFASVWSLVALSWLPVVAVVGSYLLVVLLAAGVVGSSPASVVQIGVALVVMHISWGVGFLLGPPVDMEAFPER